MRRPTLEQGRELVAHFGSQRKAAEALGVGQSTIAGWLNPERAREYYAQNAERERERCRRYYAANRERVRKIQQDYYYERMPFRVRAERPMKDRARKGAARIKAREAGRERESTESWSEMIRRVVEQEVGGEATR